MKFQPENTHSDMLSIVFADRNQAYGAYQLRRQYPQTIGRAMAYGFTLIFLFFSIPYLSSKFVDRTVEVIPTPIYEPGPPPDIDPDNPPIPPPPAPTPPPPTRSTMQYVPPVVVRDAEAEDLEVPTVEDLVDTKADVGKKTEKGNDDAPPSITDNPKELAYVEPPKAPVEDRVYEMFDIHKPPSFPGGEAELLKYLAENIKYPPLARENNIQGVVALTFVVDKDGRVREVNVLKDIGGSCGKEALRVVETMPRWLPGEANGHPVKVRFTLPVRFRLE
ncbi:MAG: energy transducer TonB [Lewinellaceae bacterium]|nr:energy transducer TonB [Lewinellaceae bacterium]